VKEIGKEVLVGQDLRTDRPPLSIWKQFKAIIVLRKIDKAICLSLMNTVEVS
jgi:hypothetical protein